MSSQTIRLLALLAVCLVVLTGLASVRSWMSAPKTSDAPPKRPSGVIRSEAPPKAPAAEGPCKIRRAIFGGTRAALLRVPLRGVHHYVVLDMPTDNPMMPFYQADWLHATFGKVTAQFMGEFANVDGAVQRAATLCKRN